MYMLFSPRVNYEIHWLYKGYNPTVINQLLSFKEIGVDVAIKSNQLTELVKLPLQQ